jgi:hypothetical protein
MNPNRRSFIVGAGFATAAPALVRAESMLEIPGNPLTARGLLAASKWAVDGFGELPACRLAFANGDSTKWAAYTCVDRSTGDGNRTHAVAIEVVTTDAAGKRFITSVPVDGVKLARDMATTRARQAAQYHAYISQWVTDDGIPF